MAFNHALHSKCDESVPLFLLLFLHFLYYFFFYFISAAQCARAQLLRLCASSVFTYESYPHDDGENLSFSLSFCWFSFHSCACMAVCVPSFCICVLLAVLFKYSVFFFCLLFSHLFFGSFDLTKASNAGRFHSGCESFILFRRWFRGSALKIQD